MTRRALTFALAAFVGAALGLRAIAQTSTDIRVLSYNIRHGQGNDDVVNLERTAETIRRLRPDIVGLQEVDDRTKRTGGVPQADELGRLLGLHAAFGKFMDYQGGGYGLAVLSRYPILNSNPVRLPDGNEPRVALVVEVRLPNGQPLSIITVHFDWVNNDGFRFAQASELAKHLDGMKSPYVLLGDFNDLPDSRTLALFKSRATEARKTAGASFTFSSSKPEKEIDYIFYSPAESFRAREVLVIDEPMTSDHRPVFAVLEMRSRGR